MPRLTLNRNPSIATLFVAVLALLLIACERAPEPVAGPQYATAPSVDRRPLYRLAVHPLHNPQKLVQAYQPLIDLFNQAIPEARFELEASRDYSAYEAKFHAEGPDKPELLLPNPWQTLQAMKAGYRVIAMAGNADDFKGIFIIRVDSPIKTPSDLKGKAVAYPAATALAASIMPQWFLHQNGININRDIQNRYVGSQESSILSALNGETAIAATWPPPWRLFQRDHPVQAAKLKVIWETPPLLNNSVMVRDDVPDGITNRIRVLLFDLYKTAEGRTMLVNMGMDSSPFQPANDARYDVVREFVARFEREVRPVKQR